MPKDKIKELHGMLNTYHDYTAKCTKSYNSTGCHAIAEVMEMLEEEDKQRLI